MLKHYVLLAWLNFRRSPVTGSINILTLALGLVCFILAWGITSFWDSAESHFENSDRTVVISSEWSLADGSETSGVALPRTPHHLAAYLRADFPQIESIARVVLMSETTPVRADDTTARMRSIAADAEFLAIFQLPFISGDQRHALSTPRSAVVTAEAAQILYGDTRVIGRTISLFENVDAVITGVLDQIPGPSHIEDSTTAPLRFDVLVSRDVYEASVRARSGGRDTTQPPEDWLDWTNTTYALLPGDGSFTADELQRELPAFADRHISEAQRQRVNFRFDVVAVSDLLGMAVRDTLFPQLNAISVPALLLVLGSIVLLVACINFANLATARTASRAKEVGIRRTIGARPTQIIMQHLIEAASLTAAALLIALVLTDLLVPIVSAATSIDLRPFLFARLSGWSTVFLLVLGVGVSLAAGFYPAFVLSRVRITSSTRLGSANSGSRTFAAALVTVQFALAAFLLISLTIVSLQNRNLVQAERELTAGSVLVIENSPETTGLQHETLRQELLQLTQVRSSTTMQILPWTQNQTLIMLTSSAADSAIEQSATVYVVGYDFFSVFGIRLIAGRLFDPERLDDLAAIRPGAIGVQKLVISRSFAENLGYTSAAEIVGKRVYMPRSVTGEESARPFDVIGVVEDKSLSIASRYGAMSKVYLFNPEARFHVVRLTGQDFPEALTAIDSLWRELAPNVAINRRLLTEYFNDSYNSFARLTQGFTGIAFIAWVISTIGLYAMAILVSSRRVREIAIRRTLGASKAQIVLMLLRDFSTPVLWANFLAWPFAYLAGSAYLNVFTDPVPLTLWPFVIALGVSLLISWATVGWQAWRAANTSILLTADY